jgi:hypothetical protein
MGSFFSDFILTKLIRRTFKYLGKKVISFKEHVVIFIKACKVYDFSVSVQTRRFLYLLLKKKYQPREAFEFGVLNPELSRNEIDEQISYIELNKLISKINPKDFSSIMDNKILFYKFCDTYKIPFPKIYAIFYKDHFGITHDEFFLHDKNDWLDFINNYLPHEFIVKPTFGAQGKQILLVMKRQGRLENHLGETFDSLDLYTRLEKDKKYHSFLFQERVVNHRSITELTGTRSLQTMRIITYAKDHSDISVVFALLKIISGNNVIDNHFHGKIGNICGFIDIEEGIVTGCYSVSENGYGYNKIERHPDTGNELRGFSIPYWKEVVEAVAIYSKKFFPLRTIGWDVAVTEEGHCVIEGNAKYMPFRNMGFLRDILK